MKVPEFLRRHRHEAPVNTARMPHRRYWAALNRQEGGRG